MKRGGPTRLGIIIIVLIVAALLIGAIFWVGQSLFSGGETSNDQLSAGQKLLANPNEKTSVKLLVRGPITAQEKHYSFEFSIGSTSRKLTASQGYDGKVLAEQNFANSIGAFKDFVAILNREKFANSAKTDLSTSGICADGQVLNYQIFDGDKKVSDLWNTSCDDKGTYAGENAAIGTILDQFPDSRTTINDVKIKVGAGFAGENLFAL